MQKWIDGNWFKILYFILAAFSFNSLIAGRSWMTFFSATVMAGGIILLLWRCLHLREYRNMPYLAGCILFWLSYLLSSTMNISYGITGNLKALLWMAFQFCLLYCGRRHQDSAKREFRALEWLLLLYPGIQALISLLMLVFSYSGAAVERGMYIGVQLGRLWGSYSDPNYGAVLAVVSVIFSAAALLKGNRTGWLKRLHFFNIWLQYFYVVFSYSRTGQICLLLGAACLFWFWCRRMESSRLCKMMVGACVLILCLGGGLVREGYNRLHVTVYAAAETDSEDALHREEELSEDITNGRLSIWKDGIAVWRTSPVYGVSYRNIASYLQENLPDSYMANRAVPLNTFHNVLMDVLVSQGIAGIVLFLGLAFFMARKVIRILRDMGKGFGPEELALAAALLVIGCGAMFLSDILYINSPTAVLFWWCMGGILAGKEKYRFPGRTMI